jgi:hypothetical protein
MEQENQIPESVQQTNDDSIVSKRACYTNIVLLLGICTYTLHVVQVRQLDLATSTMNI